jgi:multidrug efflux system membrane fusion protein
MARVLPLVLLLALAACSRPAPPPVADALVLAAHPSAQIEPLDLSFSGEIRPRFESTLSFRIDGKILKRQAHLGDRVVRGQTLAELDPADATASLSSARSAQSAAAERLDLARRQRDRSTVQSKDELVSQAEVEQNDSNFAIAQAELDQRAQELTLATHQAQYATLVADHDGFITSEGAEVGAFVKAGQSVFGLAWAGDRDVFIDVPESRIGGIARGQAASVTLPASNAAALAASVREIAEVADPQSRTYRIKLALADPRAVRPGMSARVVLRPAADDPPLTIPASALFHQGADPAVWVIGAQDHRLLLRPVVVSRYDADAVQLASGLSETDLIVTQGVHTVVAGQRVRTVEAPAERVQP